jgi:hypothetical protein
MRFALIPAMVHGGLGIQGIEQTDFYRFISSADGLSQLGIDASNPPKLLEAYKNSAFSIEKSNRFIALRFGDVAVLKAATPHPASGTGQLRVASWLEWIIDEKREPAGFVPRENLPASAHRSIRLNNPLGGLMLSRGKFGSTGMWRFPSHLMDYEEKWFGDNITAIQTAIVKETIRIFTSKLVS